MPPLSLDRSFRLVPSSPLSDRQFIIMDLLDLFKGQTTCVGNPDYDDAQVVSSFPNCIRKKWPQIGDVDDDYIAQEGDDGKFVINGKMQCTYCIEKDKKFPKTNHPVSDCHTLKKEIAKKKNGGGKGGKGGKGRGGGRRGRRGGKGKQDKGKWSHAEDWDYGPPTSF